MTDHNYKDWETSELVVWLARSDSRSDEDRKTIEISRELNARVPARRGSTVHPSPAPDRHEWAISSAHKRVLTIVESGPKSSEQICHNSNVHETLDAIDDLMIAGALTVDTNVRPVVFTAVSQFTGHLTREQKFALDLAAMVRRATKEVPSKQFRLDMYADLSALLREWSAR